MKNTDCVGHMLHLKINFCYVDAWIFDISKGCIEVAVWGRDVVAVVDDKMGLVDKGAEVVVVGTYAQNPSTCVEDDCAFEYISRTDFHFALGQSVGRLLKRILWDRDACGE